MGGSLGYGGGGGWELLEQNLCMVGNGALFGFIDHVWMAGHLLRCSGGRGHSGSQVARVRSGKRTNTGNSTSQHAVVRAHWAAGSYAGRQSRTGTGALSLELLSSSRKVCLQTCFFK